MSSALKKVSYRRPASTSCRTNDSNNGLHPTPSFVRHRPRYPGVETQGTNSRTLHGPRHRYTARRRQYPLEHTADRIIQIQRHLSLSLKSARSAHGFDLTSLNTAHQPHPTHQSLISCEKISHRNSAIPSNPPHRFGQFYCRHAAYLLPNYAYQRKVPAMSAESSKHTAPSAPKFASPAPTPTTAPARPLILSTSTSTASHY
jgi:hypothetical protein